MRFPPLAVLAFLALPCVLHGQSQLDFPRTVLLSDLASTGYAVVNPSGTPATITFTLYTAGGNPEKTSAQTVPARGQLAKLGAELFPGAANGGWVQATSSISGLQGFWLGGDFGKFSFLDGAEAAPSASQLVLPMVSLNSEIHIANTGTQDVVTLIELYGESGALVSMPYPVGIPRKGSFTAEIPALFPGTDFSIARHVRLRCGCDTPLAASVIARNLIVGPSWVVANAIPSSTSTIELNFPHVVDGPAGGSNWQSFLSVTNLSTIVSNEISITFVPESGSPVQAIRTLQPAASLRESARALFSLPAGYQTGWVKVTSPSPITGFVAYADTINGGVAVVPAQAEAQTTLLFAHIADLVPWWTGLGLLNATARAANVEVFAVSSSGSLIGGAANVPTARFVLPAGAKTARLLSEMIPQTQSRGSDGGFVFVRSDQPLYGIELFFTRDLKVLSNVAAGRVLPGITYTPPSP